MANSKARDLASLLSGSGTGTIAPALVSDQNNTSTGFFDLPAGTTAERPSNPTTGYMRFNSTIGLAEFYDGISWRAIDAPPTVTAVSPTTALSATETIAITGTNFNSGATVSFIGDDGTVYQAPTVVVVSTTQINATVPAGGLTVANEPYTVRVSNSSGLAGLLESAIDAGASPEWQTNSGNIGTVYEDTEISSLSVAATDADGQTVSISLASGSDLPSGLSVSSSGEFSGTPNVNDTYASIGVTHTFDLEATDGINTTARTFNIIRKWKDGSTLSQAARNAQDIYALSADFQGASANGTYYLDPTGNGTYAKQYYCHMNYQGGGWVLVMALKRQADSTAGAYSCDVTGAVSTIPHSNPYLAGDRQAKEHNDVITALQQQNANGRYWWMFDSMNYVDSQARPPGYSVSGEWPPDGTNMLGSAYSRLTLSLEGTRRMIPGQGLNQNTILYGTHTTNRTVHNAGQNSGATLAASLNNTAGQWNYSGDERIYCLTVGNGLQANNGIASGVHTYADTCGDSHTGPYTLHQGVYNCYHAWELIFVK